MGAMTKIDIQQHQASEAARAKAQDAGFDIDLLKSQQPQLYMIFHAETILRVHKTLRDGASQAIYQALPHIQLFDVPAESNAVKLLSFPPLGKEELEVLDSCLAQASSSKVHSRLGVYFRVVQDFRGEHREFSIPTRAAAFQGDVPAFVGPFASEELALDWARERLADMPMTRFDSVPHASAWYVDIFLNSLAY